MKTIDGVIFKQLIISGANNLYNCYPEVDALNVFPVPDGDTGTNMNLTISSGAKEIANKNDTSISEIAKIFSRGILMGARGNSGVILSQIFRGFAQGLEGKAEVNACELADAFIQGKTVAYKAVMKPVEGTILTVVREAAQCLLDNVTRDMSIEQALEILLTEAKASLQRTPDLLPVLKEVGVVDSGGTGLVKIFEGFVRAIKGEIVEKRMIEDGPTATTGALASEKEGEGFGYCTEFILRLPEEDNLGRKKIFIEGRFKGVLNSHGNSVVEVRDEDLVKVHIHTLYPGNILNYAQQFGEFVKLKIENMTEQHSELTKVNKAPEAPKDVPLKEFGLIAVGIGSGINDMFNDLRVDVVVSGGQTMNPSTEDFLAAIKKCHAKKIFIMPNNSNIIMAASQACEVTLDDVVATVIPSKTIPQGLLAAMMFNPEVTYEENIEEMKKALGSVKTGQVTYAIKDTKIEGVEVKKDQYLGIYEKDLVCCHPVRLDTLFELISKMVDEATSIITVMVGEGVEESEVKSLTTELETIYSDIDLDVKLGNQPVYSYIIAVE